MITYPVQIIKDVSCPKFLINLNADKISIYGESHRTSPKSPGLEALAPLDVTHTCLRSSVR